tara:strand:+ start:413 stop:943 length:531 start_codon:yes stop_codon:yes gene_type:complete
MTSKLKVNILADGGDNAIMTSNGSGTLTLNNAALKATPAFEAHAGSNQTLSNNTYTKLTIDTEIFDSNSKFASDRFTPTIAGKYFIYGNCTLETGASEMYLGQCSIYKNGSIYQEHIIDFRNNNGLQMTIPVSATIDMDTDDYVELYGKIYSSGSTIRTKADNKAVNFGAYRIIGV